MTGLTTSNVDLFYCSTSHFANNPGKVIITPSAKDKYIDDVIVRSFESESITVIRDKSLDHDFYAKYEYFRYYDLVHEVLSRFLLRVYRKSDDKVILTIWARDGPNSYKTQMSQVSDLLTQRIRGVAPTWTAVPLDVSRFIGKQPAVQSQKPLPPPAYSSNNVTALGGTQAADALKFPAANLDAFEGETSFHEPNRIFDLALQKAEESSKASDQKGINKRTTPAIAESLDEGMLAELESLDERKLAELVIQGSAALGMGYFDFSKELEAFLSVRSGGNERLQSYNLFRSKLADLKELQLITVAAYSKWGESTDRQAMEAHYKIKPYYLCTVGLYDYFESIEIERNLANAKADLLKVLDVSVAQEKSASNGKLFSLSLLKKRVEEWE